ncbi:MAG: S-layer protein [Candidatus Aenigmarchaeota archaeon]|nr:S-layer protein [Candidatus Aenigmarchaeota archaeon]
MQEKFKKVAAGAVGLLTAGATLATGFAGVAFGTDLSDFAAGNVFTTANTIVVVGPNAAMADNVGAINIGAKLAQAGATYTGSAAIVTAPGVVSLDTVNTKIYLGSVLNTAKSFISKTDLPTLLADSAVTYEDGTEKKITNQRVTLTANAKLLLSKDEDTKDPTLYISGTSASSGGGFGTDATVPLYNLTASFETANLTKAIGKKMTLFGQEFTIAPTTSTTQLVLYTSATDISLSRGDSVTVTIGGVEHTIELIAVTGGTTDKITLRIDGQTDDINEAASKKINGVNIYADRVSAYQEVVDGVALNSGSASLLVGSEKVTFGTSGTVKTGDDEDSMAGTRVTKTGTYAALTSLTISVASESSTNDYISMGESFTDRVFGTFKLNFAGVNPAMDDSNTDTIAIAPSGSKATQITMTDQGGIEKTMSFAYTATPETSDTMRLQYDSDSKIATVEGVTLSSSKEDYFVAYGDDVGKLLKVTDCNTHADTTNKKIVIKDVFTDDTVYDNDPATAPTFIVGNKVYTVANTSTAELCNVTVTTGSNTASTEAGAAITGGTVGVYNPIVGKNGEYIYFYYPITSGLNATGVKLPDGTKTGATVLASSFTSGSPATVLGGPLNYTITGTNSTGGTVGTLAYINTIGLTNSSGNVLTYPAVVLLENNNDVDASSTLTGHVIPVKSNAYSSKAGIGTVYSSPTNYNTLSYETNTDLQVANSVYGTMVVQDTSTQGRITLTYPDTQTYGNIYLMEVTQTAPEASSSQNIQYASLTTDGIARMTSDASVAADKLEKNVILVGGPAINSLVAELAAAEKTPDVTYYRDETKAGSLKGKALIQVIDDAFADGNVAIVVSGYEAAQTRAASLKLATEELSGTAVELEGSEVSTYDFEGYKEANAAAAVEDEVVEDEVEDEVVEE